MVSAIGNEEMLMHFNHPELLSLVKTSPLVSVPKESTTVSSWPGLY